MPKLVDFRTQNFAQGAQIKAQYQHNKELWGGICFALMCEWFKLMNVGTAADKRMAKLEDDLTLCGSRQKIYKDYFAAFNSGGGGTYGALADTMSQQGNLFGVQFGFQGSTEAGAASISDYIAQDKCKDKFYYLSIKFAKGGHAIGISTATPITIFDPNFGEHVAPKGKRTQFFKALWAEYKSYNMVINNAIVFEMSKKKTIFDFWEKKSKTG